MAFCKKIQPKVKQLLAKFEDEVLQQALQVSLHVTSGLKAFLNKPDVIRVVELTNTDIDNKMRDQLIKAIDEAVQELMDAKGCKALPTMDARMQCYREHIANIGKSEALDELRKLAVEIVRRLHGAIEGKSFYNAAFELFYLVNKK